MGVEFHRLAAAFRLQHLSKARRQVFEILDGLREVSCIRHGQSGKQRGELILGCFGFTQGFCLDRLQKVTNKRQGKHTQVGSGGHRHCLRFGHPKGGGRKVARSRRVGHCTTRGRSFVIGVHLGRVLIDFGAAVIFGHGSNPVIGLMLSVVSSLRATSSITAATSLPSNVTITTLGTDLSAKRRVSMPP